MGCAEKFLVVLVCLGVCHSIKLKFRPFPTEGVPYVTEIEVNSEHETGVEFDGIGGISGGGATSKLLINYPKQRRDEILDYLFKPDHAASLQILKVEIGGDSQSTDGSESSHMHESDDENYNRGYEWWLMKEAKQRNPKIKLYGLPWVFPGWLGTKTPYSNFTALADYYIKWVKGAKFYHDLDIDYIGIWNERWCNPDFVKFFKARLVKNNLSHIKIVVPDSMDWSIADELIKDPEYLKAVDIIGQHYPAASSPKKARALGLKLWASEDFSAYNDLSGGGCWARVLNEGPAFGYYSGFIAWNLITSYYAGLPYTSSSLMSAQEPWSGSYSVDSPIWMTAHHTFFYQPGWKYLPHGSGVGILKGNGTYISLVSPDESDLTIVISTLDPKTSHCFYGMPKYSIADKQKAVFMLDGKFKSITKLHRWYSKLDFVHKNESVLFVPHDPVEVMNGIFVIDLDKDTVITLTTVDKEKSEHYPTPPPPEPFPVPYYEDFERYELDEEPFNFAQQSGAYEVTRAKDPKHNLVMTQVTIRPPIDTCYIKMPRPPTLIGNYFWKNVQVKVDAFINNTETGHSTGVYLASQVSDGGCDTTNSKGVYFWVNIEEGTLQLSLDHNRTKLVEQKKLTRHLFDTWFTMELDVTGNKVTAKIDDAEVFSTTLKELPTSHGFVVLGPNTFGKASFDNFAITRADRVPRADDDLSRFIAKPGKRQLMKLKNNIARF